MLIELQKLAEHGAPGWPLVAADMLEESGLRELAEYFRLADARRCGCRFQMQALGYWEQVAREMGCNSCDEPASTRAEAYEVWPGEHPAAFLLRMRVLASTPFALSPGRGLGAADLATYNQWNALTAKVNGKGRNEVERFRNEVERFRNEVERFRNEVERFRNEVERFRNEVPILIKNRALARSSRKLRRLRAARYPSTIPAQMLWHCHKRCGAPLVGVARGNPGGTNYGSADI